MGQAKQRGTREQRIAEALQRDAEAPEQIDELEGDGDDFPRMFWGYDRERRPGETPFDVPDDMVCMVSNITPMNQAPVNADTGIDFELGEWFVSTGRCADTVVHGPFDTLNEAFEYARTETGAIRFIGDFC